MRIYSPPPSDEDGGEPPAEASLPEEVPLSHDDADDTGADVLDDEPTELSDVADELLFDSDEPDEPLPEVLLWLESAAVVLPESDALPLSGGGELETGVSVTVLLLTSAEAFSSDTDGVTVVSEFSAFAVVSMLFSSVTVPFSASVALSVIGVSSETSAPEDGRAVVNIPPVPSPLPEESSCCGTA